MIKLILVVTPLLAIILMAAAREPVAASNLAAPPTPQPLRPTGNCSYDNVFYGAVPPGGRQAPVLVFVHGLSGLASDWWSNLSSAGLNDMYIQAYNAGYRTAFVNLNVNPDTPRDCSVVRRPANDMIGNGRVLSQQLDAITQYYGVDQVDIIAHSKGGIDAQAAIVWWGAWRKVRNVFTLGSPHQGSLLADLFWSPEGFWVGILLRQRDDATFSLQTSSMQLFRSLTDPMTVDDNVHYYSGAGNFWNTPGTIYKWTGEWLQNHPQGGDNDGAVTVASTYLSGATTLFLQPWNHTEVYLGRNAFPYIHQILQRVAGQGRSGLKTYLPLVRSSVTGSSSSRSLESSFILRGGRLGDLIGESVPIEPQVRTARFTLLTTDEEATATLSGPDGSMHPLQVAPSDGQGIFASAFQLSYTVSEPGPGQWNIQIDGPPGTGYLLVVTLDSPLRVGLDGLPDHPLLSGEAIYLNAWSRVSGSPVRVGRIQMQASRSVPGSNDPYLERIVVGAGSTLSYILTREGLYGASITVTGETAEGLPFERSFVRSLAVVPAGGLADASSVLNMLSGR